MRSSDFSKNLMRSLQMEANTVKNRKYFCFKLLFFSITCITRQITFNSFYSSFCIQSSSIDFYIIFTPVTPSSPTLSFNCYSPTLALWFSDPLDGQDYVPEGLQNPARIVLYWNKIDVEFPLLHNKRVLSK